MWQLLQGDLIGSFLYFRIAVLVLVYVGRLLRCCHHICQREVLTISSTPYLYLDVFSSFLFMVSLRPDIVAPWLGGDFLFFVLLSRHLPKEFGTVLELLRSGFMDFLSSNVFYVGHSLILAHFISHATCRWFDFPVAVWFLVP